MIALENVWKAYKVGRKTNYIAKDISITFPTGRAIGLFGRNGAGKSTLLRMLAGLEDTNRGAIRRTGTISWPIGFAGAFHPDLTGAQNIKFVARLYGADTNEVTLFVRDFADLGDHFYSPFRTYSAGMRARLAFGVSMGVNFDTYLIDEVTAVGDQKFKEASKALLKERIGHSTAIIVSHSMPLMKDLCDCGVVLIDGRAKFFDDVSQAIETHNDAMSGNKPAWAH